MKRHTKTYMDYFGYGIDDVIICECCDYNRAVDIHHVIYKSRGGSDSITNLCALCRDCHNLAHAEKLSKIELQMIHNKFLANYAR